MADQVALVTGGAGGLGRAVTAQFLREGWRVAVPTYGGDSESPLRELAAEHGERLTWFAADLSDEQGAAEAVERTVAWAGRLDAVVHTVGGYVGGHSLTETPVAEWDRMMSMNLRSAFLVARAALPRLEAGGALVFVSSRAAVRGRAGNAAYAISKSALLTLTEAIADENRGRIRANAVLPGTIDTPANRAAMPDADASRWTPPEEIARVVVFLASPASAPVSGAAVPVYGAS